MGKHNDYRWRELNGRDAELILFRRGVKKPPEPWLGAVMAGILSVIPLGILFGISGLNQDNFFHAFNGAILGSAVIAFLSLKWRRKAWDEEFELELRNIAASERRAEAASET